MIIIGISTSHDGSLSVVKDGINIFSIGEERLNRIKAYVGFPFLALRYIIDNKVIQPEDVDLISVSSSVFLKEWAFSFAFELTENKKYFDVQNEKKPHDFFIEDNDYLSIKNERDCKEYVDKKIKLLFKTVGIDAPVEYVEHHMSHASSAYYTSGLKKALSITMDGEGDLLSATVNICEDGKIERISETNNQNSAGYIYSAVTVKAGFKRSRHEGKITGLAAYGNSERYKKCFEGLLKVENGKLIYVNPVKASFVNRILKKSLNLIGVEMHLGASELIRRCGELSKEDLSASVQYLLERKVVDIVSYWVNKTNIGDVVLSGGLFANVKFNQYISEIDSVKSVYVFPDMGDGGNSYGAAAFCYFKKNKFLPEALKTKNVSYGPKFSNRYIKNMLDKFSDTIEFKLSDSVEDETAQLLADNKIVGWFQGAMEYGPRALGNRSIIASPTDSTINSWLNERMKRNEFMPFAPSCLYEYADKLFVIPKKSMKFTAQFMTMTFRMRSKWANLAPAVSHVDQTARPQLVTKEANPRYYKLLKKYHILTGLPLFINTSFNVHEEPIVCTPEEGLKSLTSGVIDYFVCEDYICQKK
jgi:carbamoyltransferase